VRIAHRRAVQLDARLLNAVQRRSLLYHGAGQLMKAFEDARLGLQITPNDEHSLYIASVTLHGMGQYHEAVATYRHRCATAACRLPW
jgi:hypothetical protein